MRAVDSSIAIAAFASWHERHDDARALLRDGLVMPAHAVLETYSVLTRLPPPHRAPANVVQAWLRRSVVRVLDTPACAAHLAFLERLSEKGIDGGATYDALIAWTTAQAGGVLVSVDERARRTYDALGVAHEQP